MIEEKQKEINGANYTVTQFAARRGLKIKTKLVKLLAPTAIAAMGAVKDGRADAQLDALSIGNMLRPLLDNLDSDSVVALVFELLASTRRNGEEITGSNGAIFDEVYSGNFGELFNILKFVVEVNFMSFFQEVGIGNQAKSDSQTITSAPKLN